MTKIDAPLGEEVFDLAQRQRLPDVHHYGETNDRGRATETAEWISHWPKLRTAALRLKPD